LLGACFCPIATSEFSGTLKLNDVVACAEEEDEELEVEFEDED